ncbi:MAG TPA: hypothetical protein VJ385_13245 [Fibrobacteria bacterium]|nr:hypothetical protein [Fibrobacteria bacterium]
MRITHKYVLLAAMAASTTWLGGCFLGSDDGGPSAEDVTKSNTSTTKAAGNLESSMTRMSDFEQFEYGKEDLTDLRTARADYAEAVRLNPGNSQAQLGMALTGILLAAQSNRLSTVINQTLDAKSPFDTRLVEGASPARAGVLRKVAQASTLPEFHVIQDAIADTLLPALEDAIARLESAYHDPAFAMTLTVDDEPRELDHAEAGILLAGVRAIHGLLTLWLSRDIDVDFKGSYDYLEAFSGLDTIEDFSQLTLEQRTSFNKAAQILGPASPFLTVRPGWAARLAGVDDEIKAALAVLKESVASIDLETDPQSDDLVHLCALFENGGCIERSDYADGKDVIDTAIKYMAQPYVLELPDLDTAIKVNFAAYFNVQDYKKLLPYYGFYNADEWSDAKPVLYFTDARGQVTGNVKTLAQIAEDADSLGTPAAQVVAQLRAVIHFQDPTFQGFLPGATEAGVWNLILKQAEHDEGHDGLIVSAGLRKSAVATLKPDFALSLIGK